ncbi:multidrug effflux MFS transporter [Acidisphaera sp. L21]|uniref:multidrug effflux MFS transporter n=1 Tax=Acidisphaera sp. L21 TaxID=1641851 RepID=UPI00131E07AC|nr:multidrug effflux MFS transporter [Acidisphaera sp. L21]
MALKRDSLLFTLFLGAVCALPPLSIDMGLPGIPAIEATFADAAGRGPLTLSLFLVGFAISPIICGPLADRFGRRWTLLVGLGVFSIAATGCALAPSFHALLAVRMVQGLAAGCCAIVPFAVVRDLFEGATARHRLSQVTAVLGIAPMVAPVFGAWVMAIGDWRSIYALQALSGLILLGLTAIGLTESLPVERRRSVSPTHLVRSYGMVLSDRPFRGFCLVYALGFACMFSYISGSPGVVMGTLGLGGSAFSLLFGATSCGVLVGSLISGRLSKRAVSSRKVLSFGLALMFASALGALGLVAMGVVYTYTLMPLMGLVIFCFGLIAPSTNHEAMHNLPQVAGAASGIMRCVQMVTGAVASASVALLEPLHHPALVMTFLMALFVVLASGTYLWQLRGERALRVAPANVT